MATIRKAEYDDLNTLLKLAVKIFSETFESANNPEDFKIYMDEAFNENKIQEELNEKGSQYYVALEGEIMVGYARLRENSEVDGLLGGSHIELQRIYVDAPWQGRGISVQLLKKCEEHALHLGKDWIWLGVWEHNPKAKHFYQKHGYEKFSEHRFLLGNDPQTDWLMKKNLSN